MPPRPPQQEQSGPQRDARHPSPSNPPSLAPPRPLFDQNTLAILQLLAQSQGFQQSRPDYSTSRHDGRGEGPSSSPTNAHRGRSSDDGNAEDDDEQIGQYEPGMLANTEDKRQRNTAASARFRNKKRQWVLNMERSVTSLSNRVEELERAASDLRRENGWLKEIVMLKTSQLMGASAPPEPTLGTRNGNNVSSSSGGAGESSNKRQGKRNR